MSFFTHALAGGAAAPEAGVGERQPLISVLGRVLAVANAPGSPVVDFYDAGRAADVSAALGPGHAKLRYLSSFPVTDVLAPVGVTALAMLPCRGGLLAVAGESRLGMVVLVYRFGVSAVGLPLPLRSAAAVDASDDIAIELLPSLVFRASLPGIHHVQLLPHPSLLGVLGVRLAGDTAVRFYDVGARDVQALGDGGATPSVTLPGPRDAEVGAVETDATDGALVAAAVSTDGSLLVVASARRAICVYALDSDGGGSDGQARRVAGALVARFTAESDVTALSTLPLPAPADAALHGRYRFNGHAVASGHTNGFLNLWWCGDLPPPPPTARAAAPPADPRPLVAASATSARVTRDSARRGRGHGGGDDGGVPGVVPPPPLIFRRNGIGFTTHVPRGAASSVQRRPAPTLRSPPGPPQPDEAWGTRRPFAAYPPLHASHGPVESLSDGVVVAVPGPATALGLGGGGRGGGGMRGGGLASVLLVGAHGAAGVRPYVFRHPLPAADGVGRCWLAADGCACGGGAAASAAAAAAKAAGAAAALHTSVPDRVARVISYDADGRRVSLGPPPLPVAQLSFPRLCCPSYAECLRAPILGDRDGDAGALGGGGRAFDAAWRPRASATAGMLPRGIALLRLPGCTHDGAVAATRAGPRAPPTPVVALDGLPTGMPSARVVSRDSTARLLARVRRGYGDDDGDGGAGRAVAEDGAPAPPPLPHDAPAAPTPGAVAAARVSAGPLRGAALPALATLWATEDTVPPPPPPPPGSAAEAAAADAAAAVDSAWDDALRALSAAAGDAGAPGVFGAAAALHAARPAAWGHPPPARPPRVRVPLPAPAASPPPELLYVPRVIAYCLTERGVTVAGLDYASGLATHGRPAAAAAAALDLLRPGGLVRVLRPYNAPDGCGDAGGGGDKNGRGGGRGGGGGGATKPRVPVASPAAVAAAALARGRVRDASMAAPDGPPEPTPAPLAPDGAAPLPAAASTVAGGDGGDGEGDGEGDGDGGARLLSVATQTAGDAAAEDDEREVGAQHGGAAWPTRSGGTRAAAVTATDGASDAARRTRSRSRATSAGDVHGEGDARGCRPRRGSAQPRWQRSPAGGSTVVTTLGAADVYADRPRAHVWPPEPPPPPYGGDAGAEAARNRYMPRHLRARATGEAAAPRLPRGSGGSGRGYTAPALAPAAGDGASGSSSAGETATGAGPRDHGAPRRDCGCCLGVSAAQLRAAVSAAAHAAVAALAAVRAPHAHSDDARRAVRAFVEEPCRGDAAVGVGDGDGRDGAVPVDMGQPACASGQAPAAAIGARRRSSAAVPAIDTRVAPDVWALSSPASPALWCPRPSPLGGAGSPATGGSSDIVALRVQLDELARTVGALATRTRI